MNYSHTKEEEIRPLITINCLLFSSPDSALQMKRPFSWQWDHKMNVRNQNASKLIDFCLFAFDPAIGSFALKTNTNKLIKIRKNSKKLATHQ